MSVGELGWRFRRFSVYSPVAEHRNSGIVVFIETCELSDGRVIDCQYYISTPAVTLNIASIALHSEAMLLVMQQYNITSIALHYEAMLLVMQQYNIASIALHCEGIYAIGYAAIEYREHCPAL